MAVGKPVLYAPNAGLPEVAGDVGLRVDPTRPDRIAARLAELAKDDAARAQLGAAGRERAAKRFRWDNCVARLVTALS
jgi:glycosyltransferase involved in cell wall biosynthesis